MVKECSGQISWTSDNSTYPVNLFKEMVVFSRKIIDSCRRLTDLLKDGLLIVSREQKQQKRLQTKKKC